MNKIKVKWEKVYKGPMEKKLAQKFVSSFKETAKLPYLEIERGNAEKGYKIEKIKNFILDANIRKRKNTDLFDVYIKNLI